MEQKSFARLPPSKLNKSLVSVGSGSVVSNANDMSQMTVGVVQTLNN